MLNQVFIRPLYETLLASENVRIPNEDERSFSEDHPRISEDQK